jgi:hypothetical protein
LGDKKFDDSQPQRELLSTDYADKQTDLALEYLKEQKDRPDPELLRRLKWSKEDLNNFYDRWRAAKDQAASDPSKRQELDAALRSLGLQQSSQTARGQQTPDDGLSGYRESGNRVRPPESLRERFERFQKAQNANPR